MNIRIGQPDTGTAYSIESTKVIRVIGLSSQPIKEGVVGYLEKTTGTDDLLFGTGQCRLLSITADGSDWLIDYSAYTDAAEIAVGDTLRLDIQQPDLEVSDPVTFTRPVKLTGTNTTYTLTQTGILSDLGGAINPVLNGIPITVPYPVEKDDRLQITGTAGQTYTVKTIKTSSTGPMVDTGQLGAKVIQQGVNGAIYSINLNKVLILGRGMFDEDEKYIIGEGAYLWQTTSGFWLPGRYKSMIEVNGYIFFHSFERLQVSRLNVATREVVSIYPSILTAGMGFSQVAKVGDYIYSAGYRSCTWIDLNTLAYGDIAIQNLSTNLAYPVAVSPTSYFIQKSTALNKVVGTTTTYVTVLNGPIAYHDGYVYVCTGTSVQKVRETDLVITSTITTNASGTVIRNEVYNGFLYTLYTNGTVTEIDLSTFDSPARTFVTGFSITQPDFLAYNGHIYFISQNGSSFMDITLSTGAYNEILLQNTHNSINVDEVNNRLIFFSGLDVQNVAQLKPVEIIQL